MWRAGYSLDGLIRAAVAVSSKVNEGEVGVNTEIEITRTELVSDAAHGLQEGWQSTSSELRS